MTETEIIANPYIVLLFGVLSGVIVKLSYDFLIAGRKYMTIIACEKQSNSCSASARINSIKSRLDKQEIHTDAITSTLARMDITLSINTVILQNLEKRMERRAD